MLVTEQFAIMQESYLNDFSSSMTWMPCSKVSLVGASPTDAKWPLTAITGGAVYREAAEGRLWPFVLVREADGDAMVA